jgi:hypothetical protein
MKYEMELGTESPGAHSSDPRTRCKWAIRNADGEELGRWLFCGLALDNGSELRSFQNLTLPIPPFLTLPGDCDPLTKIRIDQRWRRRGVIAIRSASWTIVLRFFHQRELEE